MNDLLLTFREKGKKKGYNFDEKLLKEENVRVNIELQNFIKNNGEAQKMINVIKSNNATLQKQKEILVNAFSSEDKNKVNAIIQQIINQNTEYQSKIKKTLDENYVNFISDIEDNGNLYPQERRISKNLHGATVKNFQDAMIQFQSLESELKSINERMIIRSAEISTARNVAMFICRDYLELKLEKIGQIFGGRKHTTVMHGCDNVNDSKELKSQAEFAKILQYLKVMLMMLKKILLNLKKI